MADNLTWAQCQAQGMTAREAAQAMGKSEARARQWSHFARVKWAPMQRAKPIRSAATAKFGVDHMAARSFDRSEPGAPLYPAAPSRERPALPAILPSGAYCPNDLARYLREASRAGMQDGETAVHLRVPVHRLVFWRRRLSEVTG